MLRVRVKVSVRVKINVTVSSSILTYCRSAGVVHSPHLTHGHLFCMQHHSFAWYGWRSRAATEHMSITRCNLINALWMIFYTVSQKKLGHFYYYCNFGKCWSILKILLLLESEGSSWWKEWKNFPLHLNFVAALPCKTNTSMNACVKLWRFCIEKHRT